MLTIQVYNCFKFRTTDHRCTLYIVHCKCPTYNVHCIRYKIYTYNVKGTISYGQFTMYNVQCPVYNNNVETPMYNVHCTIYIANVRSTMNKLQFISRKNKNPFHVLMQMLTFLFHHYLHICLIHCIQCIGRPKDKTLDITVHGVNPVLL